MTSFDLSSDPALSERLVGLVAEGGSRLIVIVEGDRCCWMDKRWLPPERFRVLDKPCERCGGRNRGTPYQKHMTGDDRCPNPNCAGGRKVVEFHTTCPTCRGRVNDPVKPGCVIMSTLVCRATVRLLPVVADGIPDLDVEWPPCIFPIGDRWGLHLNRDPWLPLTFDTPPRPGVDWGLMLTIVEDTP